MIKMIMTNINGYIEGYYGKILNWNDRRRILINLKKNNLNSYFYCPKEDLNHRLNWRKPYSKKWLTSFNIFCNKAIHLELNVLTGISPGLDFNFKNNSNDFEFLFSKALNLINNGSKYIVLMFDDIPEKKKLKKNSNKTEGFIHAELSNLLFEKIPGHVFVVPRVYSDELIVHSKYLEDFCKNINKKIPIFYCGKQIVAKSQSLTEISTISNLSTNKIIIWDNLYANDYCPKKIFLGPWIGRDHLKDIMVNLTGMIETDLFLLDLISLTIASKTNHVNWKFLLKKYKIPKQFLIISKYFFPINYINKNKKNVLNYFKEIEVLDFLLWKWKTPLSREWYQYLLILKQDLQLFNGELDSNRIKKIFPIPLYNAIINKWGK